MLVSVDSEEDSNVRITPRNYDFELMARGIITEEVRGYVQGRGRISSLARKATVAPSTVSKVAYGETKRPRMHTIVGLLDALGYDVELKKREVNGGGTD